MSYELLLLMAVFAAALIARSALLLSRPLPLEPLVPPRPARGERPGARAVEPAPPPRVPRTVAGVLRVPPEAWRQLRARSASKVRAIPLGAARHPRGAVRLTILLSPTKNTPLPVALGVAASEPAFVRSTRRRRTG